MSCYCSLILMRLFFFALLKEISKKNKIDLNTNYSLLSKREKDIILYWTWDKQYTVNFLNEQWIQNKYKSRFEWVINTLTRRYYDWWADKWNYDDFIVDMDCHLCDGHRLNKESLSVYLSWKKIYEKLLIYLLQMH